MKCFQQKRMFLQSISTFRSCKRNMINNEKKFFGDRKKEEKKNYKFM